MHNVATNPWKLVLFEIHAQHSNQPEDKIKWRTETVQCLARDGRIIHFTKPADVSPRMDILLSWLFEKEAEIDGNREKLTDLLARLWITFVSIHPFLDHNGKTALGLLDAVARKHEFTIADPTRLKHFLITGKSQLDLQAVATIIGATLRRTNDEKTTDWNDGFLSSSKSSLR